MGEIKQTNFRINEESAKAFRKYCEENGVSQAQGFDHIMQVVELNRAKTVLSGRTTEIESFEKSVKDIMAAYLYCLEINKNAEERIREQFASKLDQMEKLIADLRQKSERLQAEKETAEATAADAIKAKELAEKFRVSAEKIAEDKKTIADTLAAKLAESEKKVSEYDELRALFTASEEARKTAEQQIKDLQRDAAENAREAERAKERAVQEITDTLKVQISSLQNELRVSKSETDTARRDTEVARTTAIAELSEVHRTEIAEIRNKLDARTEDLMKARQEINSLQLKLQTIKHGK